MNIQYRNKLPLYQLSYKSITPNKSYHLETKALSKHSNSDFQILAAVTSIFDLSIKISSGNYLRQKNTRAKVSQVTYCDHSLSFCLNVSHLLWNLWAIFYQTGYAWPLDKGFHSWVLDNMWNESSQSFTRKVCLNVGIKPFKLSQQKLRIGFKWSCGGEIGSYRKIFWPFKMHGMMAIHAFNENGTTFMILSILDENAYQISCKSTFLTFFATILDFL